MQASLLLSKKGGKSAQCVSFEVARSGLPVTLFASGLQGAEQVRLSLLATGISAEFSKEPDWLELAENGRTLSLSAKNNFVALRMPGIYRVSLGGTKGLVHVGVY